MCPQTLWKARLSYVCVLLQFTSGIAYKNITQICLIQPIFYMWFCWTRGYLEGFCLLPVTDTVCAGEQRAELLVTAASKVRGGVAAGVEECSFSSCLSTSQQMKLVLIPGSFLLRICHYLSFKLQAEVLLLNALQYYER